MSGTDSGGNASDAENKKIKQANIIKEKLGFNQAKRENHEKWPEIGHTVRQFAGWAPTVSSRFTFSMIGEPANRKKPTANIRHYTGKRVVAHLSERFRPDAFRLSRNGKDQDYYCFMVGETATATRLKPNHDSDFALDYPKGRKTRDSASPRKLRKTGRALDSATASNGVLTGIVCLFPKAVSSKRELKKLPKAQQDNITSMKNLPSEITKTIANINVASSKIGTHSSHDFESSGGFMSLAMEPILKHLKIAGEDDHGIIMCRFELYRSGEVRLYFVEQGFPKTLNRDIPTKLYDQIKSDQNCPFIRIDSMSDSKSSALEEDNKDGFTRVTFSRDAWFKDYSDHVEVKELLKEALVRRAELIFDFVRDTVHSHYHHDIEEDRMVNIYHVEPATDFRWRIEALHWLMSGIQRRRRRRRGPLLRDALGILSYVEAAQCQLLSHQRCQKNFTTFRKNTELRTLKFAHLRSSINTELAKRQFGTTTNQQLVVLFVTIILACLALASSQSPARTFISENLLYFTVGFALVSGVVFETVSDRRLLERPLGKSKNALHKFSVAFSIDVSPRLKTAPRKLVAALTLAAVGGALVFLLWRTLVFISDVLNGEDVLQPLKALPQLYDGFSWITGFFPW